MENYRQESNGYPAKPRRASDYVLNRDRADCSTSTTKNVTFFICPESYCARGEQNKVGYVQEGTTLLKEPLQMYY